MIPKDFTIPYLIINLLSVALIFICAKYPKTGRSLVVLGFLATGTYIFYSSFYTPYVYYETLGKTAFLESYKTYITSTFEENPSFTIALYGFVYILIAIFLSAPRALFGIGVLAGVISLLILAPLGTGVAFPSTIIMSISLIVLYVKFRKIFKSYKYN